MSVEATAPPPALAPATQGANHPTYVVMVTEALLAPATHLGVSRPAIKNFIKKTYGIATPSPTYISRTLKAGCVDGTIVAVGARFKLSVAHRDLLRKLKKAKAKPKKKATKKKAPKKKKSAKKGTTTKKTASKKKTSTKKKSAKKSVVETAAVEGEVTTVSEGESKEEEKKSKKGGKKPTAKKGATKKKTAAKKGTKKTGKKTEKAGGSKKKGAKGVKKTAAKKTGTKKQTKKEQKEEKTEKKTAPKKRAGKGEAKKPAAKRPKHNKGKDEAEEIPALKRASSVHVIPQSGLTGDVYRVDDVVYEANLAVVHIDSDTDKYYKIQIVKADDKYHLVEASGRTGTRGECEVKSFDTPEAAIAAFEAVFLEKSGAAWSERDTYSAAEGKYSLAKKDHNRVQKGVVMWKYYMDNGVDGKANGWYDYAKEASEHVEATYQEFKMNKAWLTVRSIKSGHFSYHVNFSTMSQQNLSTKKTRKIQRFVDGQANDE